MSQNSTRAASVLVVASLYLLMPGTAAKNPNVFLGGSGDSAMTAEELERELVEADTGAVDVIERALAPLFATLPTNGHGQLGHAAVSYALHRYFVHQHGWHINGMATTGDAWNASSTTSAVQGRVPAHIQEMLERRFGGRGLRLRELAVLASLLQRLVREEYLDRLKTAYRLAGAPVDGRATAEQVRNVTDKWMATSLFGGALADLTDESLMEASANMGEFFPFWEQLSLWIQDVQDNVAYGRRARDNPFVGGSLTFEAAGHVVSELPRQFDRWHHSSCLELKHTLLGFEDTRGSGRVSLVKFYNSDQWHFAETPEYLRMLGALDESNPGRLRVIVPNYLSGRNQCVEASSLHSACCKDECEAILAEVEQGIAATTGAPEEIARLVSQISSDTVLAPRNLTGQLLSKLQEVSRHHGGRIPLHGRLFAQWMHHAFPNECPHPHVSGTTVRKTPEELEREGVEVAVNDEEREQFAAAFAAGQELTEAGVEVDLPWSEEEELLSYDFGEQPGRWEIGFRHLGRVLLLVAFLSTVVVSAGSALAAVRGADKAGGLDKFVV